MRIYFVIENFQSDEKHLLQLNENMPISHEAVDRISGNLVLKRQKPTKRSIIKMLEIERKKHKQLGALIENDKRSTAKTESQRAIKRR